jgi:hypothetical protein
MRSFRDSHAQFNWNLQPVMPIPFNGCANCIRSSAFTGIAIRSITIEETEDRLEKRGIIVFRLREYGLNAVSHLDVVIEPQEPFLESMKRLLTMLSNHVSTVRSSQVSVPHLCQVIDSAPFGAMLQRKKA